MSNTKILDIIPINTLNKLIKSFNAATGFPVCVLDSDLKVVAEIGNTDLYEDIICKTSIGASRCAFVREELTLQSAKACKPVTLSPMCGLYETAVPCILKNEGVGAIIIGPVFNDTPSDIALKKSADELLCEQSRFIAAASKIKIVKKNFVDAQVDMLFSMITALMEKQAETSALKEKNAQLSKNEEELNNIHKILSENETISNSITKRFEVLDKLTSDATAQLEDTTDTVKVIQNIAMNTRILGFNASIEASRAKESGKGFGVIAQEVRSLADVSKSSAEKIEQIINTITEITSEMRSTVVDTGEMVKQSSDNTTDISGILNNMRTKQ